MSRHPAMAVFLALAVASPGVAGDWEVSGSVGLEERWFPDRARFDGQLEGVQGSLLFEPAWEYESEAGRHQLSVAPFLRLDGRDDERTHVDLREAYWRRVWDDWELLVGVNEVFWGVTESRHLVNVINQVDTVEDVDEEDRLGQPMVRLAFQRGWGRLEGYLLTGFRERTFAGRNGRLRTSPAVNEDGARFESGAEQRRLDLALRWSHYFGDWDVGAHWFEGTSREPRLLLDPTVGVVPFYDVIRQAGVDVQYTREAWLWKLEAIGRKGHGEGFGAFVGGLEYTFYQIASSAVDVGLLVEVLRDGREAAAPPTPFDDDLFVGSRLAFNDTQDTSILLGAVVDREHGSLAGLIEAERRIGAGYRVELEGRLFSDIDARDILAVLEKDSFVTLRISRHF